MHDFANKANADYSTKLSQTIWGNEWLASLPSKILTKDGHTCEVKIISYSDADEFSNKYGLEIYPHQSNDSSAAATNTTINMNNKAAKTLHRKQFYESSSDFFAFYIKQEMAGFFVGTPIDWTSYYLRNCSIRPEFQDQGIYQRFLVEFLKSLAELGIQKAEGDVAPSHHAHIHILNKLKFKITGYNLFDNWGALLRFTKFLDPSISQSFNKQYCKGANIDE